MSSTELETTHPKYFEGEIIDRPPSVELSIFEVIKGSQKLCFIYKVPKHEENNGVIILKRGVKDCSGGRPIFQIERISKLKIKSSLDFKKDYRRKNDKFYFYISFEHESRTHGLEIPMINLAKTKNFKRYDGPESESLFPGLRLGITEGDDYIESSSKDNYQEQTLCRVVDQYCNVIKDQCDRCRYTVQDVVGKNCPNGGDRYCARFQCGQSGRPACVRGKELYGTQFQEHCFDGSPLGFCSEGLVPICDKQMKILICR